MKSLTLARLALAGTRTDALRVGLTAVSVAMGTLAVLAAATVIAIPGEAGQGSAEWSQQYTSDVLRDPGLRPGVTFTLLLLTIPVLALAAQCARIGAPGRDRRLAAFRLAGATPAETIRIAAAETGVAGLLGAALGLAAYLGIHAVAARPDGQGQLALPGDVNLPVPVIVAVVLALPLIAALVAALALRRIVVSPWGVVRRSRASRPHWWPGLLIGFGILAFAGFGWIAGHRVPTWLPPTLLATGGLAGALGLVLGLGWISRSTGLVAQRLARRPALLIAGRRLVADPWSGSRAFGAMLVSLMFGGGLAAYRALIVAQSEVDNEADRVVAAAQGASGGGIGRDEFRFQALALLDRAVFIVLAIAGLALVVAFSERIVANRRAYAALVATGVPRGTVARAALWQSLLPAVPSAFLATAVGVLLARGLGATAKAGGLSMPICTLPPSEAGRCWQPETANAVTQVWIPEVTRSVPVPWFDLAGLAGGAIALVLLTVGLSLTLLRPSTDIAQLRAA